MIATFPIDGVKALYEHSIANPEYTPSFSQMYDAQYRKDKTDVDIVGGDAPKLADIDLSTIPAQFYLVKDDGAYLMAATKEKMPGEGVPNFVVYCNECNPNTVEDHWEEARRILGGDDFGEALPLEWLKIAIDSGEPLMRISVEEGSFGLELPS